MPRIAQVQANFSAGEVSPLLLGRTDYARYQHGARPLENFLVLLQGGLQKRQGTRYVATVKTVGSATRLAPFVFRNVDALVLEFGATYIRFYKNGVRVEVAGVPVEVSTPYAAADVFRLRLTQKNDVVYITHQSYAPRKLQRTSDTSWQLNTVAPVPPPTYEAGRLPAVGLTLSAVSGSAVTVTAASAVFLASDVDREITAGAGRGIITGFTSTTVVTMRVVDTFASVTLASGTWTLTGSPNAQLKPSATGPPGSTITLGLRKAQAGAAELVTNGTFATALTGWANLSAPQIASGTHTGAANAAALTDNTKDFLGLGVQNTQTLRNTTDGSSAVITAVALTVLTGTLSGGTDNDWDAGDAYTVRQTGTANALTGAAVLSGGTAGIGWIEQAIVTVAGQTYRVTFNGGGGAVGFQVGSASQASDLLAEASYAVGEREAFFTATGGTAFLQFRNNQNSNVSVDNVSAKLYGIDGWRSEDVGKYVYVNGGLVQLTVFTSASKMSGILVEMLGTAAEAAAGAWTLESESWSTANGFPALAVFHEQRLLLLSSPKFPQTVWGSHSNGDFENFARGTLADDAFEYTLAAAEGLLQWAVSAEQLLIGAENGEFRMVGDADGALVASSPPLARPIGDFGSAALEPVRIGIAVLFAQRQGSKLREMLFTQAAQDYQAPDRSILSGHLLATATIVQMAYAKEPVPIVWMARSDGVLLGLTYERQEQILAWHRQTLGGGGAVESVAVIPHPTANAYQTWLVVRRTVGGSVTRYVEVLDDTAVGVDSARVYSGAALTTLTGLAHLNGESVALAGIPSTGTRYAVFPAQTVSGGQLTLPVACTTVYAGLAYTATAAKLPPEIPNFPTLQTDVKRWERVILRVHEAGEGLQVNGKPLPFRRVGLSHFDDGVPFFTGKTSPAPNVSWDNEGIITITHDTPLPCTILMVSGKLEVGEQ